MSYYLTTAYYYYDNYYYYCCCCCCRYYLLLQLQLLLLYLPEVAEVLLELRKGGVAEQGGRHRLTLATPG